MSKPENPQAFPHLTPFDPTLSYIACGMTLRDWFAGQALAPIISGRDWSHMDDGPAKVDAWAGAAYLVADAMLAERERRA